jgi:hypothetical protein
MYGSGVCKNNDFIHRVALSYLPSKKLILTVTSLLFMAGVIWLVSKKDRTFAHDTSLVYTAQNIQQQNENNDIDTDGDGVPDWQEVLLGTDPKDPNSKPTREQLSSKIVNGSPSGEVNSPSTNTIDGIAPTKAVIENFANFYKAQSEPGATGGTIDLNDPATTDIFIKQGVEAAKQIYAKRNPYTQNNISLNTATNLKEYFNAIARITQKNFPDKRTDPGYKDEITTIYAMVTELQKSGGTASSQELASALAQLAPFLDKYSRSLSDIKQVAVPPQVAELHVDFLNSFSNTELALRAIMEYAHDPIVGVIGMQLYAAEVASGKELFTKAKQLLQGNNVVFNKDEPGYEFQANYLALTKS